MENRSWGGIIAITVVVFLLLCITLPFSFVSVPEGYSGVLLTWGKATGTLPPGLNMKTPFAQSVVMMSRQTQLYEADAQSASKDLQDVDTTVGINYRLDPAFVQPIFSTVGVDYINRIAYPAVQEVVKQVTAVYNAEDMILKRADVKRDIETALTERLAARGIVTETVSITNFEFSEEFTKAIEAKVVAQQKVLEAENRLMQVEVEARQAKQRAEGEANAKIAIAQGEAESIRIVTDAQTKANNEITASLSPEVLQYILYDRLGGDIKVMVVPQGQSIVIPSVQP